MTLDQLIDRADEAYGDGLIRNYYDDRDGNHGDTLAKFVAIELKETFDEQTADEDQLAEARRVIQTSMDQLEAVHRALR